MKILIISPSFKEKGGVLEYNKLLLKYGQSQFILFELKPSSNGTFITKSIRFYFNLIRFIFKLITSRIDIVHVNPSLGINSFYRDGIFIIISKIFRKKVFIQWHGWNPKNEKLLTGIHLFFFKLSFFYANEIRVLSDEIFQKISKTGFINKITKGNTFVDDDFYNSNIKTHNIVLDKEINLLFLSTVSVNKGIYTTINVFEILKKHYKSINLNIAGDGKELENVIEYVKKHNISNVNFLGYVDNNLKIKTYLESDIYIFPSAYEGMPTSILEAMSFGLPIVCNKVGALPDFFVNKKMGIMIDSLDPEKYANAVIDILNNENKKIEIYNFNREYIFNNFLASTSVLEIEKEYHTL